MVMSSDIMESLEACTDEINSTVSYKIYLPFLSNVNVAGFK